MNRELGNCKEECIVKESCDIKKEICFKEYDFINHILEHDSCPNCKNESLQITTGSLGRGAYTFHINCHKCKSMISADLCEWKIKFNNLKNWCIPKEEYHGPCYDTIIDKPKKHLLESLNLIYKL